ncbi:MAG: hypothetical protein IID36_13410 [Planctomycetes bacterium]|nr:hypothetical protein [Planctomycetota bacterium]
MVKLVIGALGVLALLVVACAGGEKETVAPAPDAVAAGKIDDHTPSLTDAGKRHVINAYQ